MQLFEKALSESLIATPIEPLEDGKNNTNMLVTYELHLHSTMYLLMHTAVGNVGDQRAFYFEGSSIYLTDENGTMIGIE